MTERKAPILFSFDTPGAFLEGYLIRVDRVNVKGKPANQYTFECEDGEVRQILGTYDIDTKIRWPRDRDKFVAIAFASVRSDVGKVDQKSGKFNGMRVFQVLVDEGAQASAQARPEHEHEITDADIPF
jgi:hypothetical protein